MKQVWEKYQPIVEIVVLDKLHILSKKIQNRLGMITESEINILDIDEFTIPKFGVMFGTNLCASFDDVERNRKIEFLTLTLYRNLAISKAMDLSDLLSKKAKTNEVNMLASPQKCKVTIKNKKPIDVVKINHSLKNKKKKLINFTTISEQVNVDKKLQIQRLKAQYNFLRIDLQFHQERFDEALVEFHKYFSGKIEPQKKKSEEVKEEVQREKSVDKIYKKIATKAHPDKKSGSDEDFKKLKEMVDMVDLDGLKEMADRYDVNIEEEMDEVAYQSSIKNLKEEIDRLQKTYAYEWFYGDDVMKAMIEQSILKK